MGRGHFQAGETEASSRRQHTGGAFPFQICTGLPLPRLCDTTGPWGLKLDEKEQEANGQHKVSMRQLKGESLSLMTMTCRDGREPEALPAQRTRDSSWGWGRLFTVCWRPRLPMLKQTEATRGHYGHLFRDVCWERGVETLGVFKYWHREAREHIFLSPLSYKQASLQKL